MVSSMHIRFDLIALISLQLLVGLSSLAHAGEVPVRGPTAQFRRYRQLILPVSKDAATNQYVTTGLGVGNPPVSRKLVVDLGGRFLWVDCEVGYASRGYRPGRCMSPECALAGSAGCHSCIAGPRRPGCNSNACSLFPENPFTRRNAVGELAEDQVSLVSYNGTHAGAPVVVPRVLFSCAPANLASGLAPGAKGMVGLGRSHIALPTQLTNNPQTLRIPPIFAVCLTPSTRSSPGAVIFGAGPYTFLPGGKDILSTTTLSYTPLHVNPVSTVRGPTHGEPSYEYFVGVQSLLINGKRVRVNESLLSMNRQGRGGTKISTVTQYTTMESSIYHPFVRAFVREATSTGLTRVRSVSPFGACFSTTNVTWQTTGPPVPTIDLVLDGENTTWRIFGANSLVQVNKEVVCLAFVEGGANPMTSVVIGGYQLEDNLLQFDLVNSRLGITPSLRLQNTNCANFNFSTANV